jgi:hypothetical protein
MFSDVVPQWHVTQSGRMEGLEVGEAVAARAQQSWYTMQVYTGTKVVLKFRGNMLRLVKDSIPVLEYFWILVVD